jgi:hypothetical protein
LTDAQPSRPWARVLVIFIIFAAVFHNFWNHSLIHRDCFHYFAPYKFLIAESIRQGTIHAWYPWQFLGMPFVADIQAGWFYPLNAIYLVLSFSLAHRLFILVHYPLAAVFMDLFLRGRGLDKNSSLLAALAFGLSGYMISQHATVTMLIGAAWAPLALCFMDRAVRRGMAWALAAGAVPAIQILAGEPQSAFITTALAGMVGLLGMLNSQNRVRVIPAIGLAAVSCLVLSAVQAIPTYELIQMSTRSDGIPLDESVFFSFHPARIIELVWPAPFGVQWPEYNFWAPFALGDLVYIVSHPWSITNYLGLSVLVLAGVGWGWSRRPWKWAVLAGAVLFLILAFGEHTPAFAWFHNYVPFFDVFRFPAKYMAWFSGCVAVAAALGLEKIQIWLAQDHRGLVRGAVIFMVMVVVGTAASIFLWPMAFDYVVSQYPEAQAVRASAMSHLLSGGLQVVVINLAVGMILVVVSRKLISVRRAMIVFFAVVIVDFYLANVTTMPAGPAKIYDFAPVPKQVIHPEGRPRLGQYRIFREEFKYRGTNPELSSLNSYAARRMWERATLFPDFDAMEGFESVTGWNPIEFEADHAFLEGLSLSEMLIYNLRYHIGPYDLEPLTGIDHEVMFKDQRNDLTVTRIDNAMPRAYRVHSARTARDVEQAFKMLSEHDLSGTVILTTDEEIEETDPGDKKMAPALIIQYEPDRVVVETQGEAPGWLVLSDRHYPGWKAKVDGKPAKIYKANVLVRAVRVPAGRTVVEFDFKPRSLRLGAAVSVPAWLAAILFWALAVKRARSAGP